ncbi:MAG: hypothetical protein NTX25_03410 [Proteobacteria bacterium]|nr:hypothetical protein [Pseudomonadota bacterium]
MGNISSEKIMEAVKFDLEGKPRPLEILLNAGQDGLWEKILKAGKLRPEIIDIIYSNKFVNGHDITSVITHPNITRRVIKHISGTGSLGEMELLLKSHREVLNQSWFNSEIGTNEVLQSAISNIASSGNTTPDDVQGLPSHVAILFLTILSEPMTICQIMLDHTEDKTIRQLALDLLWAKKDSLKFNKLVNSALMEAFKNEGDDEYRRRFYEILKEITPRDFL